MLDDLKRVAGKQNLLFDLPGAVLEQPDGIVRDPDANVTAVLGCTYYPRENASSVTSMARFCH
jgi:hypothetical protein